MTRTNNSALNVADYQKMKCNAMEPGEFKADLLPFLCSRGGLLKRIGRAQVSFKVAGRTRGRAKT